MKYFVLLFGIAVTICGCKSDKQGSAGNVGAKCNDDSILQSMRSTYSVAALFDMTKEEAEDWINTDNINRPLQGPHSYDVDTAYDKNCVLSVVAYYEWLAAYPTLVHEYFTFNKRTGEILSIYDIVDKKKTQGLKDHCAKLLEENVKEGREDLLSEGFEQWEINEYDSQVMSYYEYNPEFEFKHFYLDKEGIVFTGYLAFHHASRNLQPRQYVKVPIDILAPYLREDFIIKPANW